MQDRVPEARIYKVWLAPEWISDEATYLQLADYVLTSGKTSRLYQRLVYEDQIATDAGAFLMSNEIAGAYVAYATVAEGEDMRGSRARARRGARALPRRRPDAGRARAREDRDSLRLHSRHRAGRRLRRQVADPRRERRLRRPARLLQALARRPRTRATPQQVRRGGAQLDQRASRS